MKKRYDGGLWFTCKLLFVIAVASIFVLIGAVIGKYEYLFHKRNDRQH